MTLPSYHSASISWRALSFIGAVLIKGRSLCNRNRSEFLMLILGVGGRAVFISNDLPILIAPFHAWKS